VPLYLLFVAFGVVAHGSWPADGLPFWTPVSFAWRVADTPVVNHPTIQLAAELAESFGFDAARNNVWAASVPDLFNLEGL